MCAAARAEVILARFGSGFGVGYTDGTPVGSTYLDFQVDPDPLGFVSAQPSLFENIRLSPSVVGHEFFATPATDSDFALIAAKLTDGQDEQVFTWLFEKPAIGGRGSGFPRLESDYLGAAGHPDLFGRSITSISLTVTSYRSIIYSPKLGVDDLDYMFAIYGVPEPSSATLGVCSAVALTLFRPVYRRRYDHQSRRTQ
jgi:hypothetical protein